MSSLLEHIRAIGPELFGGFAGYWLHHWHDKLFARVWRLLGRARRAPPH